MEIKGAQKLRTTGFTRSTSQYILKRSIHEPDTTKEGLYRKTKIKEVVK